MGDVPYPPAGPVEVTLVCGEWPRHDEAMRNRAIVLDLAGATEADVRAGFEALDSARCRLRSEWDYFTSVIVNRIALRVAARREVAAI